MDTWRIIRLWVCVAGIVATLAAGGYARLRGERTQPHATQYVNRMLTFRLNCTDGRRLEIERVRSIDPFIELEWQMTPDGRRLARLVAEIQQEINE